MPEYCYTETQVKLVKALIVAMMSVSIFQALTIRRLLHDLSIGRFQFEKLHEAADYLCDILNANDVELTEFDVIALGAITGRVTDLRSDD